MKEADHSKDPKTQKGPSMAKAEKSSRPKAVVTTSVKMGKDGKDVETNTADANGSLASNSHPKQSFSLGTKSRPFNDREVADRNSKPTPVPIHARVNKVNICPFLSLLEVFFSVNVLYALVSLLVFDSRIL